MRMFTFLQIKKLDSGELKRSPQGYTAGKWWHWDTHTLFSLSVTRLRIVNRNLPENDNEVKTQKAMRESSCSLGRNIKSLPNVKRRYPISPTHILQHHPPNAKGNLYLPTQHNIQRAEVKWKATDQSHDRKTTCELLFCQANLKNNIHSKSTPFWGKRV